MFRLAKVTSSYRPTWKQRISFDAQISSVCATLQEAECRLVEVLQKNLLPFWIDHIPRTVSNDSLLLTEVRDGGRFLNLILLSRYLWFVSRLVESPYGNTVHAELARRSYRQLKEYLHDSEHGGFYWELNVDTNLLNKPYKHLYGQAFAIYGLSQYGKATGDRAAVDLAGETFALLETHAHDLEFGGYREFFGPDWGAAQGSGYLGRSADLKLLNTHMHMLEALTELFEVAPSTCLRERIIELIGIMSETIPSRRFEVSLDCHFRDWSQAHRPWNRRVSYGHELESIYLLVRACNAIELGHDSLLERFEKRFAYTMRFGFDFKKGGFFMRGPLGRRATNRKKIWWVQAEAMLAALLMYWLTLERHYLSVFQKTLQWLTSAQIDWQEGEWHRQIDSRGEVRGSKVDRWKGPYHNGRAVLVCLALIEELLGSEAPSRP